jgi:hypothetical protein
LLKDPSNPFTVDYVRDIDKKKQNSLLYLVLDSEMAVLSPINSYLLLWYVFTIAAILYNYAEVGIVLIYDGAWVE